MTRTVFDALRQRVLALGRGAVLAGMGLLGPPILVLVVVPLLSVVIGPLRWSQRWVNLARRLAGRWSGVEIPGPYLAPPPPPVPGPDGRYQAGNMLYKSPRWPAYQQRVDWLNNDPATGRDCTWLLFGPLYAVVAAVPLALVVLGTLAALALSGVAGVLVLLAAVLLALAAAPAAVRLHGRLTRTLLGPSGRGARVPGATIWIRCAALSGLALIGLAMFAVVAAAVVLIFFGLVFAFPPLVESSRWLPNLRRQLARDWSDVDIPVPYRPRPEVPRPDADGLYRDRFQVHRTPRMLMFNRRWEWISKDPATWRDLLFLLVDPFVTGMLTLLPFALVLYGVYGLLLAQVWLLIGGGELGSWYGAVAGSQWAAIPVGFALTVLGVMLGRPAVALSARWSRLLLRPTERERLAQRVRRLTETRGDAIEVQAAELRRIERDLHDGAQARMVAVGLGLGAVEALIESDPAAAKRMVARARETSAQALQDLRDLVRGIHPPVLAERGLADAVRALVLDGPLPATVEVELPGRLEPPVESAAYFAVSEAVANAVRHARASRVEVRVRHAGNMLHLTVTDDGRGGADPAAGTGLRGIGRRLGTFDGTVNVVSPPGGPTTVTMEIPCALSSRRTSTS